MSASKITTTPNSRHISPSPAARSVSDKLPIALHVMATPLQIPLGAAGSPSPRPPTPVTSFPENGSARTCNGDSSAVAHHIVAKTECSPEPYFLPRIPRTIAYNGVTFDVARPEELSYEVPVFGERRRKAGTAKPKKTLKRRCEEEEEIVWEAKRRSLFPHSVLPTHC